jgi:two-component system, cell cycle sensor histidine kinase and response regulator CckA
MKTILVVDDEEAMVSLVRDALTLAGYEVLEAGSGAAALELEQAHTGTIDLLLTDIVMPDLSGPDLARKFSARRPRAKVLYMSAFSVVDFAHHTISVELGVPILTKPFTLDTLERKVRELLAPSPFSRPAGSGP